MEYKPGSANFIMSESRASATDIFWKEPNEATGRLIIDDAFPISMRKQGRDGLQQGRHRITWRNDAYIEIVGSKINRLRGCNGFYFNISEYPLCPAEIVEYLLPMIAKTHGVIFLNGTPMGHDHMYDMFIQKDNDHLVKKFFIPISEIYPEMTQKEKESHDIIKELYYSKGENGRRIYAQEFELSFEAPVSGAVWGKVLEQVEKDSRIQRIEYNASHPVHTAWDLGKGNHTVIWFFQQYDGKMVILDHYAERGEVYTHFCNHLNKLKYSDNYGTHWLPHDANRGDWGAEDERDRSEKIQERMRSGRVEVLSIGDEGYRSVNDQNELVALTMKQVHFNKVESVLDGLDYLRKYSFTEKMDPRTGLKTTSKVPNHDESSDHADSFRYAVRGYLRGQKKLSEIIDTSMTHIEEFPDPDDLFLHE